MSEMTQCNYCTLRGIRAGAKIAGEHVYQRPGCGGVQIYVVPHGKKLITRDDSPHWVAWFMELTTSCAC